MTTGKINQVRTKAQEKHKICEVPIAHEFLFFLEKEE